MPLSRRALLGAALSIGHAGTHGAAPEGAAPARGLVWRPAEAAFWRPGATAVPIPTVLATCPVATAGGVWAATRDARLQRWAFDDGWRRDADVALPVTAHALAASDDGQAAIAACGDALLLFDARGTLLRRYEGTDLQRRRRGRASALFALPHRRSLLAAWPALGEWWEISLDPDAPPVFEGLVHDYRMGEGIARPGHFGVRRVPFDGEAPRPAFTPIGWPWVAAASGPDVAVVHMDVRRVVARLPGVGARVDASVMHAERWWLPAGGTKGGLLGIDPRRWIVQETLAAPGPVQTLATAGGALWALAGRTLFRWTGTGWAREAEGVAAIASGPGTVPLAVPDPWQGVVAMH